MSQEEILRNNIINEEGPLKKEKAEDALNLLLSTQKIYKVQDLRKAA